MPLNDNGMTTSATGACPDTAELAALLRHDAPDANVPATVDVASHIEGCPACQRRLDELADVPRLVGGQEEAEVVVVRRRMRRGIRVLPEVVD